MPQAVLKPVRRRTGWLWALPGVVLVIVGVVVYLSWVQRGPRIVVHFNEGHGLKSGDAVRCRGITVGEVTSVELSPDLQGVDVVIDLRPTAAQIAVEDSHFWIVRPQAALTGVSGLDTVVGAKYVAVFPGSGKRQSQFIGQEEPPVLEAFEPGGSHTGLKIVLWSRHMRSLRPGVPLLYRQVPIGIVTSTHLAGDATAVEIDVYVRPEYSSLVCEETKFWHASGFKFTLTSGLKAESVETALAGGVAMATPDKTGTAVQDGKRFELMDQEPSNWEKWKPKIHLKERIAAGLKSLPHLRPKK
jgi:paraquat-inducible protein B